MKVCPMDRTHNRFLATAHVTEDWVVDGDGNYIELSTKSDCTVVHEPDDEDVWTCSVCGTEAITVALGGVMELCHVCGAYESEESPCRCFVCGYCDDVSHEDTLTASKDKMDENMYCSEACADKGGAK